MNKPLTPHAKRDLVQLVQDRVAKTILGSAELFGRTPETLGVASSAALEVAITCDLGACMKGTGQRITVKQFLDTWLAVNAETIAQIEKEVHKCL